MSTAPAAAPTTTTPSRLNSRPYIIAAAVILAVCMGVYLFLTKGKISTDDAQIDGRLVPVASKVSGYISQLLVDDNRIVTQGQVIARIDPRDRRAELDRANASLDAAEAQAAASTVDVPLTSNTTNSAILAAEANIAVTQAQLLEARGTAQKSHNADILVALAELADRKATYERAHSDLGRMQALISKKEISSLQFDRYAQAERSAQGHLHRCLHGC